jgi:glycerophosphoryl diester phosphodiesterase
LQRPWILPLLIFLAIQGVFFGYLGRFLVDTEIELPLVTAHRGSSFKAPENSLSAIRAAFEDGADIIEIDIQMTSDGILVLNHDRSLTKVAGVGERVHNLTFEEIAILDIGSRFSRQFSGEKIPTLAEVITYMIEIPSSVKLNVELKDYGFSPGISEATVQLIKEMDFSNRSLRQTFPLDLS